MASFIMTPVPVTVPGKILCFGLTYPNGFLCRCTFEANFTRWDFVMEAVISAMNMADGCLCYHSCACQPYEARVYIKSCSVGHIYADCLFDCTSVPWFSLVRFHGLLIPLYMCKCCLAKTSLGKMFLQLFSGSFMLCFSFRFHCSDFCFSVHFDCSDFIPSFSAHVCCLDSLFPVRLYHSMTPARLWWRTSACCGREPTPSTVPRWMCLVSAGVSKSTLWVG